MKELRIIARRMRQCRVMCRHVSFSSSIGGSDSLFWTLSSTFSILGEHSPLTCSNISFYVFVSRIFASLIFSPVRLFFLHRVHRLARICQGSAEHSFHDAFRNMHVVSSSPSVSSIPLNLRLVGKLPVTATTAETMYHPLSVQIIFGSQCHLNIAAENGRWEKGSW